MGAIGALRSMTKAGKLGIVPSHVGQVGPLIDQGLIPCDVAMVQVSPADADGNHSFGLISDHTRAMVRKARLVIAEINDQVPYTYGEVLHSFVDRRDYHGAFAPGYRFVSLAQAVG